MLDHLGTWAALLVRWLHVVVGAAWIGASFYFVWLNNNVRPPKEKKEGVEADLWAIHGGGLYHVEKFDVVPATIPGHLHWFKWEAYFTWLTGITLLCLVYYFGADAYLVDRAKLDLATPIIIAISAGSLVVGFLFYEAVCRSPMAKNGGFVGLVLFGFLAAMAWGLSEIISDRAAYIHIGALMGTWMAGNVFVVIIPNQRLLLKARDEGSIDESVRLGKQAALRSLHNNYLTLPVLFIMVSNHYPMTYGHPAGWAILAGLGLCGALIRHWFNLRGQDIANSYLLPAAALGIIALALVTAPKSAFPTGNTAAALGPPVPFAEAQAIVYTRCLPCHSKSPTQPGFAVAPQGIMYDSPQQIRDLSPRIKGAAVDAPTMPLGNLTQMTDEERVLLGRWIDQGAKIQ